MNEIDWSKAPEDATHYLPESDEDYECWLKPGFAIRLNRNSTQWFSDFSVNHKIASGKAIPHPLPQWNGEGMPPVGCVCEYSRLGGEKFYSCEIVAYRTIAHHGEYVWLRTTEAGQDHVKLVNQYQFRPIRTPEQIAQDNRNAAVKEMVDRFAIYDIPNVPWRDLFAQMHDAGYRKAETDQ